MGTGSFANEPKSHPTIDYISTQYSTDSQLRVIFFPRGIWQCLETFLMVTIGGTDATVI